jgi:hypothetical protein
VETLLATKEDLIGEIGSTKEALANWKRSIIKWMFFFWILQLITTFVFIFLISKIITPIQ